MNHRTSLQALTWGTLLAALAGAILLSSQDAGLPDANVFSEATPVLMTAAWTGHRHAAPMPARRTHEVEPRRREAGR